LNEKKIFEYLMELAERMGFRVIKGKGDFDGGDCRVNEDKVIVINKIKPIEYQSKTVAEGLANYGLSDHYLIPAVRTYIEEDLNIKL
jgi:ribosomal protein L16/L10AE